MLQYAPVHRNKDIVDFLGFAVFPLLIMGRICKWFCIGVGVFAGDALYASLENGFATTEAYVGSDLVLGICN